MGIRQKFFLFAGLIGIIVAIVSCIGYYTAYTNLEASVEQEIFAAVDTQGARMDGWVRQKAAPGISAANLLTALDGNPTISDMHEMMSLAANDKEILSLTNGNEKGLFMTWTDGDKTGTIDPRQRPWYIAAKSAKDVFFTEAYTDATTKKLVVSAVMPYFTKSGKFAGAICDDISLDVLNERVQAIKYRGEGKGMIIQKDGKLLATTGDETAMSDVRSNEGLREHFDEMLQKGSGYFFTKKDGIDRVYAYTTVKSTG